MALLEGEQFTFLHNIFQIASYIPNMILDQESGNTKVEIKSLVKSICFLCKVILWSDKSGLLGISPII